MLALGGCDGWWHDCAASVAITSLPNNDFVDFAAPSLHEVVDKAAVVTGQELGDEVVVGRVQLPINRENRI